MKYKFFVQSLSMAFLVMISLIATGSAVPQDAPHRIDVTVKRFSYSPSEITVKKGDVVVLSLTSEDVEHGLKFKELNLDTQIKKGTASELKFTATKTGDFVGHCSHFCGAGHGSMTLTVHVTE
jgi:cytochrome c oxidase subunit 2